MALSLYIYAGGCFLLALSIFILRSIRFNRSYKLPPVVAGAFPIVGNLLQLPPVGHEAGAVVKEWAEQYGEM
jgi:hypothetical protein